MAVPDEAIRWFILHATTSNVELAGLSNVCRSWRRVVKEVIVQGALAQDEASVETSTLLLPSMIRALATTTFAKGTSQGTTEQAPTESFCAAWFHPDGIQEQMLAAFEPDEMDDSTSVAALSMSEPFSSSARRSRLNTADTQPTSISERHDESVVAFEWRGYRSPYDVLRPFGYACLFIGDVLEDAIGFLQRQRNTQTQVPPFHQYKAEHTHVHQPSFAVRGVTVARPEGYCLCLDAAGSKLAEERREVANAMPQDATQSSSDHDSHWDDPRNSLYLREKRRRDLQRDVFPRVLFGESNIDLSAHSASSAGLRRKRPRALQFLNVTKGHAVCMISPPFACGPLQGPVTIFCVGITTDDGCFLSGLHTPFELGHLYPNDPIARATDRSVVCIATETTSESTQRNQKTKSGNDNLSEIQFSTSAADDSSFDDDSEQMHYESCGCIFHGATHKLEVLEGEDTKQRIVHRGRTGPGEWHCYTAIFDGENSQIRVDGIPEIMQPPTAGSAFETHGKTKANAKEEGHVHESPVNTPYTMPMLDGLTLGTDHGFDMALCWGDDADGNGQGAMAEVAVFQGRLADVDIQAMEDYLLRKHGLSRPVIHTERDVASWRYRNDMERAAHASLLSEPQSVSQDHEKSQDKKMQEKNINIPLRFLARNRLVAWSKTHPVTGDPLSSARIGSKASRHGSSSDW